MKEETINQIISKIKILFTNDYTGHDLEHTIRVYKMALHIADSYQCNKDIITLAALLHDVDDPKIFTTKNNENAKKIMQELKIETKIINKVIDIINNISFKGTGKFIPDTIEGKIVQDADRLDALGAIGIARAFAYGGSHRRKMYDPKIKPNMQMDELSYRNTDGTTINHFYEKLFLLKDLMNTEVAKQLAIKRTKIMEEFITEFINEWN